MGGIASKASSGWHNFMRQPGIGGLGSGWGTGSFSDSGFSRGLYGGGNKALGLVDKSGLGGVLFKPMANAAGFQDPRDIKIQQQAHIDAQKQALLSRQSGMSQGLTGGASAGGQIQAYNSVLADAANQRTQLAQADQEQSMQNIGMLMSILGML